MPRAVGNRRASPTEGGDECEVEGGGGVQAEGPAVKLGWGQGPLYLEGFLTLPAVGPVWVTGKSFMLVCKMILKTS